uniref:Thioredoxin domain-containing protein n=1 Tax=Odontella aurita TaxID=265563 RepID=A0A7S4M8S6_9STRA|mmetsp:Transcript_14063/g.41215  ORF Transcript_14063/g.41215 Transcript_14063/m.41215 type:complete len:230 (+) Transcript_14063:132-821(+)
MTVSLRIHIFVGLSAFLFSLSKTGICAFSASSLSTSASVRQVRVRPPSRFQISLGKGGNGEFSSGVSPVITKIETVQDFLDFIAEDDRLSIVKFYASWCKSCQKFGVRYKRLALEEGDKVDRDGESVERGRVRFAEVEFNSNIKLCRSLGIKRLPYIHMYMGSEGTLIEDFSCSPKKFQDVIDKLNENVDATVEDIAFRKEMDTGSALLDDIAADLQIKSQRENTKANK